MRRLEVPPANYKRTLLETVSVSPNPKGKARFCVPGFGRGAYTSVQLLNIHPDVRAALRPGVQVLALVNTKADKARDLAPKKFELPSPVSELGVFSRLR